MSKIDILNYLQKGGVHFGGLKKEQSSGLSDASLESIMSNEDIMEKPTNKDPLPRLDEKKMTDSPTLKISQTQWRTCVVELTNEDGNKLIETIHKSIEGLKEQLKDSVFQIKKHYDLQIEELKKMLTSQTGRPDNMYEYLTIMKKNVEDAIKQYNELSGKFKSNISELQSAYNKAKTGKHPIPKDSELIGGVLRTIGKKLELDVKPKETSRPEINIPCVFKQSQQTIYNDAHIEAVDLRGKMIFVKYQREGKSTTDTYGVPFSNLCINPETSTGSKPTDEKEKQDGGVLSLSIDL